MTSSPLPFELNRLGKLVLLWKQRSPEEGEEVAMRMVMRMLQPPQAF